MENPYDPPEGSTAPATSTRATLAAIGAWAAAGIWGLIGALTAAGTVAGKVSGLQALLPMVIVALYVWRGWQVYQGDVRAARNLLLLQSLGAVVTAIEWSSATLVVQALLSIKLLIHVLGAIAAFFAR